MKLLFKNAYIVDVQSPYHLQTVDVLVDEDQIVSVGALGEISAKNTIDLNGSTLTTGFAELHSDLGEPGNEESEDLNSGSAAAAAGGFTAVGVVSNGGNHIENKLGIDFILNRGESLPIHLVPIGTMTRGAKGEELSEMFEMSTLGSSLFGDYKKGVSNAKMVKLALLYSKPFGRIMVHPEDHSLSADGMMNEGVVSTYVGLKGIPEIAEVIQIKRDLSLLEYTEGSLHIASVSTIDGIKCIRQAKEEGLNVTCSVNLHHLIFTDEDLSQYDTSLKVSPPIRSEIERNYLWNAVIDGTIDCLAVDHLPKDIEQKQCEFDIAALGMAGFEGAVSVFLDRYDLTPERMQEVFSSMPRKLLNLPELKIVEGEIAEFTILSSQEEYVTGFASKAFNNPFKGRKVNSSIKGVYVKGNYLSLAE